MIREELYYQESNQKQNYETYYHQERMALIVEKQEYNLFQILKPKLFVVGDKWCVLYGENLLNGIAGFGESPYKAILDFNKAWNKPIKATK